MDTKSDNVKFIGRKPRDPKYCGIQNALKGTAVQKLLDEEVRRNMCLIMLRRGYCNELLVAKCALGVHDSSHKACSDFEIGKIGSKAFKAAWTRPEGRTGPNTVRVVQFTARTKLSTLRAMEEKHKDVEGIFVILSEPMRGVSLFKLKFGELHVETVLVNQLRVDPLRVGGFVPWCLIPFNKERSVLIDQGLLPLEGEPEPARSIGSDLEPWLASIPVVRDQITMIAFVKDTRTPEERDNYFAMRVEDPSHLTAQDIAWLKLPKVRDTDITARHYDFSAGNTVACSIDGAIRVFAVVTSIYYPL